MTDDDERIWTVEQYLDGEISEEEARNRVGDDVIESLHREREAFESAIKRDTSEFLVDTDDDDE
jgi:polyhydroxyalkanoate synthesis regulator phasin